MTNVTATLAAIRARAEFARNAPTRKQVQIIDFVREYRLKHGTGPTFNEIGAVVGIASTGSVSRHVRALVERGDLCFIPGSHRSLKVRAERLVMLDLPDDLFAELWVEARRENVSLEALIIDRLRADLDSRPSGLRRISPAGHAQPVPAGEYSPAR